jgi:hypothetical protein
MPHDTGSHRTASVAGLPGHLASLTHRPFSWTRMEGPRPRMTGLSHCGPALSRGPPLPKDPDCEADPSSAGCGTRHSDDPDAEDEQTGSVDGSRQSPPQPPGDWRSARLTGVKGALRAPPCGPRPLTPASRATGFSPIGGCTAAAAHRQFLSGTSERLFSQKYAARGPVRPVPPCPKWHGRTPFQPFKPFTEGGGGMTGPFSKT